MHDLLFNRAPTLFTPTLRALTILASLAFIVACSDDSDPSTGTTTGNTADAGTDTGADASTNDTNTTTDTAIPDVRPDVEDEDTTPPIDIKPGCNPLASEHDCLLPYPSDIFLTDDPTTPSGKKVALTPEARLRNAVTGDPVDLLVHSPVDGFSMNMPLLAYFGEGIDTENVTFHTDDPAPSLLPTSTTVILNTVTGEPVPHWAELDKFTDDEAQQAFIIRPLVKLEPQTRYIVAIQNLMGTDGDPIATPAGFEALRDGRPGDHPALVPLLARYDAQVFPVLETFGVQRSDLQLAWDFTTGSEEMLTREVLAIRADALDRIKITPPAVTIENTTENPNESIALRIEGTINVPLYLDSDGVRGALNMGEDGLPAYNGDAQVPFTMQIPNSAMPDAEGFDPALIMVYGHGFFGLREEIDYGSFMRGYSDEQRYITVAVDWWGMSEPDVDVILERLSGDLGTALNFVQRLPQAFVNFIALQEAIQTTFTELDELKRFDRLLYDPDQMVYYGISQGHIFGVPMLALSPHIDRAVLGVGGGAYSLMMTRANSFRSLFAIIGVFLGEPLQTQKFLMLSQHAWDRVDPMTYAHRLLQDPYPNTPSGRRVLAHMGIGDHSVNNLASELLARAVGAPVLTPSPRMITGVPTTTGPVTDGSAMTIIDFNLDVIPGVENRLPEDDELNDVHEGVRHVAPIKAQIDTFLREGTIVHPCEGPCNPE